MSYINRVVVVGRLGRDPELKHTAGGTAVLDFSIAVNGREKGADGEWGDRTDWLDIRVWDAQAENCERYLSKGSLVAVDGSLRVDKWEKDGQKRSRVVIVARTVQFLDSKGEGDTTDYGEYAAPVAAGGADDADF